MQTRPLFLAILGLAGCASMPMPAAELQRSQASIRAAEELGAVDVPAARFHLQLAKDQEAEGRKMAAEGDARAARVLARAECDAELAVGLVREASMHVRALQADEDLQALRARDTP